MSKININDPSAWQELDWDEPSNPDILKKSDQKVAVARANRLTKTTREFIEVTTKKNRETTKNPKWIEANAESKKKLATDPKWLEANQKGSNKRKLKGQQLKAEGKIEEHRKLFGVKDQHSKQTKKQMSTSAKNRWSKEMKQVMADNVVYSNIYEAAKALGIHKDTVVYRIKNKPNQYYYIKKEED